MTLSVETGVVEALRRTTELLASSNRSTDRPSDYVGRAVHEARAALARYEASLGSSPDGDTHRAGKVGE